MNSFDNIQCDELATEPTAADWAEYETWLDAQERPELGDYYEDEDLYFPEDDGQPSEYEEWQDYMGGDDWDHGQYDY